ncbi:MAG: polysaccharide pyruvyl transferase family protein [Hydrogenophilales bacterium]|nr:polysaccharide pyruvyl transferase family protein [Hydrogenophilales bacterium]
MTTKSIAVITAPNMRYVNTGMTTVELAAKCFIEEAIPNADIKFFSVIPPNPPGPAKWMMMDLGYVHSSAHGIEEIFKHEPIFGNLDEIFSKDLVIYWGDFLQAKHYVESEGAGRLSALYGLDKEKALEFAYRALIQSQEPDEIKEKSIIFGSSLLYNCVGDYVRGNYSDDITRLVQKSRLTLMRDPISAARINHLTKDFSRSHLGIDPAFFLKEKDLHHLPVSEWSRNLKSKSAIGLFFGTRTEPPKRLIQFCQTVAEHFNVQLEWIPWFPFHEKLRTDTKQSFFSHLGLDKNNLLHQIEDLLPRGDVYTQGDLLSGLKKYAFVITDTYHLCINAWNARTPAICFGSENGSANNVIKDFKKKILYEMFDAKDFYFDVASLITKAGQLQTEKRVCKLLNDTTQSQAVCERISAQAGSVGEQLKRHITETLA